MRYSFAVLAAVAAVSLPAALSFADVESARTYITEATELIEQNDFDGAASKLELAEVELEGDESPAKAEVESAIAEARQQITAKVAEANRPRYERRLRNALRDAEDAIGNMATWNGAAATIQELIDDPEAREVLGAELDDAAKKFATFQKLHARKAGSAIKTALEERITQLEADWVESRTALEDPDISPNSRDSEIEDMTRDLEQAREALAQLPKDDAASGALSARIEAVSAEFTQIALAQLVTEQLESLDRRIESYQYEWEGYEEESASPTWNDYRTVTGGDMSRFLAPRTSTFVMRTNDLLASLADDESFQAVKGDPQIKEVINNLKTQRDSAYLKLVKSVATVVDEAERAGADDASALSRLVDDIRLTLGENSPEGGAMKSRIAARIASLEAAAAGSEQSRINLIRHLSTKATEVWPDLVHDIDTVSDPDLSNPASLVGQTIQFTSDNLMGYRYKPGDFYFATTIGGVHLAGRLDARLAKQIRATEEAIGRSIGDDDNDGQWDVYAVVTDRTAQLLARRQVEATGTVDGANVNITGEYAEPVEAIVIDIIAARCGPFAGAKDHGVLQLDGTVSEADE